MSIPSAPSAPSAASAPPSNGVSAKLVAAPVKPTAAPVKPAIRTGVVAKTAAVQTAVTISGGPAAAPQ